MTTTKTALNLQGADGKTIGVVLDGIYSKIEARTILDKLEYNDYKIVSHSHEFFRFIPNGVIKNALGIKAPYYCKNGNKYFHLREDGKLISCQWWNEIKEGYIATSTLTISELATYDEVGGDEYLKVFERCKEYYQNLLPKPIIYEK